MVSSHIFDVVRKQGRTLLTEVEAKDVLRDAGVSVVDTRLACSRDEAVAISEEIGFPVVLKIASTDITHKSDSGGVKVGLGSAAEVISAYDDIMSSIKQKNPKAKIQGVSVQAMAKQGVEIIIGMSKDPQFGPVIMFGLGGVMVEILKDVSFRLIPLTEKDASEMIKEIKGYPLLEGYRGQAPCDIHALEQLLLKVSDFVAANPDVEEIDLNPVFAYSEGAIAVDARIVLENKES